MNEKRTPETAQKRTPRSNEERATSTRTHPDAWIPASILPSPISEPDYVFRWIRTSTYGMADLTNVSKKYREGWVPVKLEDHPELKLDNTDVDARFARQGNVEVGGLMLCKAPEEWVAKRREYFANMARQQMDAVDSNWLNQTDPRMPLSPTMTQRTTRVTFGSDP